MDPTHQSDEQLAGESQSGSLAAFEELVSRHQSRLFHFLCQKAPSREDAEDLAQQTFVTAWRRIGQYRLEARFTTWLYTIARRLAISRYRKYGGVIHCGLEHVESECEPTAGPMESAVKVEEQNLIWRVSRQSLKEEAFDALWMRYREDMSITEIAAILRRTETSVKVILHRARKVLGRALEAESARPALATRHKHSFGLVELKMPLAQESQL